MRASVTVDTSPTELVPSGNWRFIAIHTTEDDIGLDFDPNNETAVTTTTAIPVPGGQPLFLLNSVNPIAFFAYGLKAIKGAGSGTVVVQYY